MAKQEFEDNVEGPDEIDLTITLEDLQSFKRLDHYLTEKLPDLSRSFIKKLFTSDLLELIPPDGFTGRVPKLELKKMPPAGWTVNVQVPPPAPSKAMPENIALEILFEDEHLLFINKPAGLVVHPAPGHPTGTLVNAVLFHCPDLKGIGNEKRPGIVHRLDMGTSGTMVVAKTQLAHEGLVMLFSKHDLEREYEAIVWGGGINKEGTLHSTIGRHPQNRLKMAANVKGGKPATTHYKWLHENLGLTHLQCRLETGRTHQIRVHLSSLLHRPILCDSLYANPQEQIKKLPPELRKKLQEYPYPFLHAKRLALIHPITKKALDFQVPPPSLFQEVLAAIYS